MKLSNNIELGYCSLFKVTPASVKWVYRAFGLFTLLWTTLLGFYGSQIPISLQLDVFKGLSCGTALTYAAAQFFGITLPTNTSTGNNASSVLTPNQIVIPTVPDKTFFGIPVSSIIIKPNN